MQGTTTSPQKTPQLHHKKTINIWPPFPPPLKKQCNKRKIDPPPRQQIFQEEAEKMLHLRIDNAGQRTNPFAQHAIAY
jgi:hypothetical protein